MSGRYPSTPYPSRAVHGPAPTTGESRLEVMEQ